MDIRAYFFVSLLCYAITKILSNYGKKNQETIRSRHKCHPSRL